VLTGAIPVLPGTARVGVTRRPGGVFALITRSRDAGYAADTCAQCAD
jgi:hypothetical protein